MARRGQSRKNMDSGLGGGHFSTCNMVELVFAMGIVRIYDDRDSTGDFNLRWGMVEVGFNRF